MTTIAFDTHAAVKRLIEAGFSDTQAESVVDTLKSARDADLGQLATKADLLEMESRMIKWLVPLLIGQAALVTALVKLL